MSQPAELDWATEGVPPRHGWQGDRGAARPGRGPQGLAIALSREAGARGGTIARLAAHKLDWQVYDQELLEFMAQDATARQGLTDDLPPASRAWIETRLAELPGDEPFRVVARLMLELAAQGGMVVIGRGAGCILPRATTLNVRIIAPLPERVAYVGQWMRLPEGQAAAEVRSRDEGRAAFLGTYFQRVPGDVHQYDLLLNSSTLGEEACADLIVQAAKARWAAQEL